MKNENLYKSLFIPWVILTLVIVGLMLCFSSKDFGQLISNIIQAVAVGTLVLVTGFYAMQTQRQAKFSKSLFDEQKLKRDLEFNERRLNLFYNPFFERLRKAKESYNEKKIQEIRDFLEKPKQEIYWPYFYMLQDETRNFVDTFFLNLGIMAINEDKNELEKDAKSNLYKCLDEVIKRLHEERTFIEDYISDNYPFPEKEIKKD